MRPWEEALDEVAIHPDPIAWLTVGGTRLSPSQMILAFADLVDMGFIEQCGVVVTDVREPLYRLTKAGRNYWEKNIKGRRRRPNTATPVPRYRRAQLAAAVGPRSVFDLSIVPCTYKLALGRRLEFDLWKERPDR
jgi:hypothetical protein